MAASILQWKIKGLRSNGRDFNILVGKIQPKAICLQETKLEHSLHPKTYQCAKLWLLHQGTEEETWASPLWRSIHICQKGLYHKSIQLGTHLQAVVVQVTLGSAPVAILSVYTPSSEHLTARDLSHLIRGLNGHFLFTGDFNGHNYSWSSVCNDIRSDVVETFTDKNNICILRHT